MKNAKLVKKLGLAVIGIFAIIAVIIVVKYFVAKKPYYFAGTLETTKVVLSARVASDISDVFVIEGDNVYAGQPLM